MINVVEIVRYKTFEELVDFTWLQHRLLVVVHDIVAYDVIATNHFFKICGWSESLHAWFFKTVVQVGFKSLDLQTVMKDIIYLRKGNVECCN